jgi:hypothetical protein
MTSLGNILAATLTPSWLRANPRQLPADAHTRCPNIAPALERLFARVEEAHRVAGHIPLTHVPPDLDTVRLPSLSVGWRQGSAAPPLASTFEVQLQPLVIGLEGEVTGVEMRAAAALRLPWLSIVAPDREVGSYRRELRRRGVPSPEIRRLVREGRPRRVLLSVDLGTFGTGPHGVYVQREGFPGARWLVAEMWAGRAL